MNTSNSETLLTATIDVATAGDYLTVQFDVSAEDSIANDLVLFSVSVNGSSPFAAWTAMETGAKISALAGDSLGSTALTFEFTADPSTGTAFTTGNAVVSVQWETLNGGVATVVPNNTATHASLLIEEASPAGS